MKINWFLCLALISSIKGYSQVSETRRQISRSAVNIATGVYDWSMIIAEGATLIERTQMSLERFKIVSKMKDQIERILKGDGFKAYMKMYPSQSTLYTDQVRMMSLKVAGLSKLILHLGKIAGQFPKELVKESVQNIGDDAATMLDGTVFIAKNFIKPDATSVVNSAKELKNAGTKKEYRKMILEIMVLLQNFDDQLDVLYTAQQKIYDQVVDFNNTGNLLKVGRPTYFEVKGRSSRILKNINQKAAFEKLCDDMKKSLRGIPVCYYSLIDP